MNTDPMLQCPDWCELERHDFVEQLRYLTHWKHFDDVGVAGQAVGVSVVKSGYDAAPALRVGVGELAEGHTTLTVEQAAEVAWQLQDAIGIVTDARFAEIRSRAASWSTP